MKQEKKRKKNMKKEIFYLCFSITLLKVEFDGRNREKKRKPWKKGIRMFLCMLIVIQIPLLVFSFFMNEFQAAETEYWKTNRKSGK